MTTAFGKEFPLNLTMSQAPAIDNEGIIKLQMDGLFVNSEKIEEEAPFKLLGHDAFPDMPSLDQREQFWIHQDTVNTLFKDAIPSMFPYTYTGPKVSAHLNESFPEVREAMGNNTKDLKMKATFSKKNVESPIKLSKVHGIAFDNAILTFDLLASNETATDVNIATFDISLDAYINFTMSNWVFYGSLPHVFVHKVDLTHSNTRIYPRDFKYFFENVATKLADDFNKEHSEGVPIGKLVPQAALVSGLIKDSTITPYVVDGWIQGGFSMYADRPFTYTKDEPTKEEVAFLQM